jgi:hypothetical protein
VSEQRVYLTAQLIKWLVKMLGDIQTVWIEALRSMELAESDVNTSIPGVTVDICGAQEGWESQSSGILHGKTFNT